MFLYFNFYTAPGFTPQYSLEKKIIELIEGLNLANFNDNDFRNSHLIRIKTLNNLINSKVLNDKLELM